MRRLVAPIVRQQCRFTALRAGPALLPSRLMATSSTAPSSPVPPPTLTQLRAHFLSNALRMMGFGLMDQTVMLQAGHSIDLTIGVMFGLSTLTAAALGEVCSNACGVLFGGTLENVAKKAGLPLSGLSAAQRTLPVVKRVELAGSLLGVLTGCSLGLINLLFLDHDKPSTLKYQARADETEFAFEVQASNTASKDATIVTVRGPDVDGILASMTTAIANMEYSLVDLDAHRVIQTDDTTLDDVIIEDIFAIVRQGTQDKIPDDELGELARALQEATAKPVNNATLTIQIKDLEEKNTGLQDRIQKLENIIKERNIRVLRSPKE